jgi:hypothetical protein
MPEDPDLRQFLESAMADDAARSRAGVGALRERRSEDATLVGVLANLADLDDDVLVTTSTGHVRRGRVGLVGPGGAVLHTATNTICALRTGAIASVPSAGGARIDGDGRTSTSLSWPLLVATIAEVGDDVSVVVAGTSTRGRLRSLSRSVAVLDTVDGGAVYVALDTVDEVAATSPV